MKENSIAGLGLSQQNTTVDQVLRAMIAAGVVSFDSKLFSFEAMNALDLDFYSPAEVRARFKKLLETK